MERTAQPVSAERTGEEGFVLLAAIVMIFLVLLALSVAAPRVAREIQRDREVEAAHRANQYVRAIQVYYRKFGHYPGSIDQLEKSNNQRFLRQRYVDPITGKDDWRLIHVGENKTKVKGMFGEDLPGLGAGLGAASGLASSTGASAGGTNSAFGGNSTFGGAGSTGGAGSAFGQNGAGVAGGPGAGGPGTGGPGTGGPGSTGTGTPGIGSQNATDFTGTGGPIMGIGSAGTGEAMVVVNEQSNYQDWEFLYDPRIEQLKAKASLLGGGSSGGGNGFGGSGNGNGLGGFGNGFGGNGNGSGNGFGGSGGGFGTPIGSPGTPARPNPGSPPPGNGNPTPP